MVLMALDHTRDWYSNAHLMGTELDRTWPALFFTRWITHFCAPVFVFLAGTGARLQALRGKSRSELSRFLASRGAWILLLEVVWIHCAMTLDFRWHWILLQVLWAIGWSMIALAGLIWLPLPVVGAIGVALCAGHDLLDGRVGTRADASVLWRVLEVGGPVPLGENRVLVFGYPILAWIGVMAAGYAFGGLFSLESGRRRRVLAFLGGGMTALFVAVRAFNRYGDPSPWSTQKDGLFTLLSFINCTKYPPSLDYLLMTLGPAILVLAALDRIQVSRRNPFLVFGRVPMFYYLVHFWLISLSARAVYVVTQGSTGWAYALFHRPEGVGYPLPVVYGVWAAVVVSLYWPCRRYAEYKAAHPEKQLLSYL